MVFEPVMKEIENPSSRYFDLVQPRKGRLRTVAVQLGWSPHFHVSAWLDTGYPASYFEYTCDITIGPWKFGFDWRPTI